MLRGAALTALRQVQPELARGSRIGPVVRPRRPHLPRNLPHGRQRHLALRQAQPELALRRGI
jgi:hypothetical protein